MHRSTRRARRCRAEIRPPAQPHRTADPSQRPAVAPLGRASHEVGDDAATEPLDGKSTICGCVHQLGAGFACAQFDHFGTSAPQRRGDPAGTVLRAGQHDARSSKAIASGGEFGADLLAELARRCDGIDAALNPLA